MYEFKGNLSIQRLQYGNSLTNGAYVSRRPLVAIRQYLIYLWHQTFHSSLKHMERVETLTLKFKSDWGIDVNIRHHWSKAINFSLSWYEIGILSSLSSTGHIQPYPHGFEKEKKWTTTCVHHLHEQHTRTRWLSLLI